MKLIVARYGDSIWNRKGIIQCQVTTAACLHGRH